MMIESRNLSCSQILSLMAKDTLKDGVCDRTQGRLFFILLTETKGTFW